MQRVQLLLQLKRLVSAWQGTQGSVRSRHGRGTVVMHVPRLACTLPSSAPWSPAPRVHDLDRLVPAAARRSAFEPRGSEACNHAESRKVLCKPTDTMPPPSVHLCNGSTLSAYGALRSEPNASLAGHCKCDAKSRCASRREPCWRLFMTTAMRHVRRLSSTFATRDGRAAGLPDADSPPRTRHHAPRQPWWARAAGGVHLRHLGNGAGPPGTSDALYICQKRAIHFATCDLVQGSARGPCIPRARPREQIRVAGKEGAQR